MIAVARFSANRFVVGGFTDGASSQSFAPIFAVGGTGYAVTGAADLLPPAHGDVFALALEVTYQSPV